MRVKAKTPIDRVLGNAGSQPKCQVFPSGNVSFHIWKQGAKVGEECLCGKRTLKPT